MRYAILGRGLKILVSTVRFCRRPPSCIAFSAIRKLDRLINLRLSNIAELNEPLIPQRKVFEHQRYVRVVHHARKKQSNNLGVREILIHSTLRGFEMGSIRQHVVKQNYTIARPLDQVLIDQI